MFLIDQHSYCSACGAYIAEGSEVAGQYANGFWFYLCSGCCKKCGEQQFEHPQKALGAVLTYRTGLTVLLDECDMDLISRLLNINMIDLMDKGDEQ